MKAFITGISGFVGAGLARELVKRGEEVHGLTRSNADLWRLADIEKQLTLHQGDVLDDEALTRALVSIRPSVVYHLASYGTYPGRQTEPNKIFETNVVGAMNVFKAAKQVRAYIVNVGTSSEYGTKDHPMREDESLEPNSYYAVSKAAQTLLGQHKAHMQGLPVVTLRLFSVYGPFEEPGRYMPTVIAKALAGKDIAIADPSIARDYVYLSDVIEAFIAAGNMPEFSGEIINVGSGVQSTLLDVYNEVIAQTGSASGASFGSHEKRSFDTATWVADVTKMKTMLGLTPRYSLAEGIKDMVKWFPSYAAYYNT